MPFGGRPPFMKEQRMTKYLTVAEVIAILKTSPPTAYVRLECEYQEERAEFWVIDSDVNGSMKGGQQSPMGSDVEIIRLGIEEF